MAQEHAQKQSEEEKLHGDALEDATAATTNTKTATSKPRANHAIPAPEDGGHARSPAAHLGGPTHDHTKPAGDLRHYEQEREPPMEVSRAGKEHRRQ